MLAAVRELIADVPAPGSDHRKNEPATLLKQKVIEIRIVRGDLVWRVRNVELDGSAAARLEVDEQQTAVGAQKVARVRLAMQ